MNIFNFLKRNKPNQKAKNRPQFVRDYSHASISLTGSDSTSFTAIDRIASEFASLSYGIYKRRSKEKVDNHPLYAVLRQPNLEELHFNFFYQSIVDYFNGGIYWLKGYGSENQLVSLFRLNPHEVTNTRDQITRQRIYLYNGKRFTDNDLLYIPSRFNYSTLFGGASIFKASQSAFDTANKLENYTNSSFDKGINGKRLIIDITQGYPDATKEQIEELRNDYEATYAGPENSGKPLFKKKGIEYSEIGQNTDNRAATLIENRQFQEKEIAKIFGFPSELLSGSSANLDIENLFILLTEFAIKPLAQQIEESINLLIEDNCYFEFNYNGLLKVSLSNRVDAYIKQIQSGLLSVNEARRKENNPPIEAGDTHFMPSNLMPLNDDTVQAYMAGQKQKMQESNIGGDEHFQGGDDKK